MYLAPKCLASDTARLTSSVLEMFMTCDDMEKILFYAFSNKLGVTYEENPASNSVLRVKRISLCSRTPF